MISSYTDRGDQTVGLPNHCGKVAEGTNYVVGVSDFLDLQEATESLAEHMQMLADHPNIDPMALQGALMGALLQGG